MSRRCLQNLLREKAEVKKGDLANEIQQVLDAESLPSHLAGAIDAVRHVGNFAAHPIKSTNTGEIMDVEPGEAEWLLDTLEGLFDFYFVQPKILERKRDALNAKLKEAGKSQLKWGFHSCTGYKTSALFFGSIAAISAPKTPSISREEHAIGGPRRFRRMGIARNTGRPREGDFLELAS